VSAAPGEHGAAGEGGQPGPPSLRPRWLWICFAIVVLAIPAIGFWLEAKR
jgi:hypothetical protein